ncbi:MAG: hypothetical protein ACF8R7_02975 [Phycisphaerales bacterium JB039]
MPTIPTSREAQINYFEQHVAIWANDPAAIGLTSGIVTNLNGLTQQARSAFVSVEAVRSQSKASTTGYYNATDAMREAGAAAIDAIRAFAKTSGDPNVYEAAQIPPPASPTPYPAPAAPSGVKTSLDASGNIIIDWDITQPAPGAQVFTVIYRRLNANGAYSIIGNTQGKQFTDTTVPVGTSEVAYQLQSLAGGQTGPFSDAVNVYLGKPGSNQAQSGSGLQIAA